MARIVKVRNNTGEEGTWHGQTFAIDEVVDITSEAKEWSHDSDIFSAIANGDLVVNNGEIDLIDPTKAWTHLEGGDLYPESKTLSGKIAVHSSSKAEPEGTDTYVVWTGAGDDLSLPPEDSCGAGPPLAFNCTIGSPQAIHDVKFDPAHGRVWIHEAYIRFENGGFQDYLTAHIMAPATQVQTLANLDLLVDAEGWVTYSPSGPGTGTHGFAASPALLPRTFAKDGDWDYDPVNGLTPNFEGNGGYKINVNDTSVHRYVHKIPCFGSSATYFAMTSDETAELPVEQGYYLRIIAQNDSNTNWSATVFMEIYRERTIVP